MKTFTRLVKILPFVRPPSAPLYSKEGETRVNPAAITQRIGALKPLPKNNEAPQITVSLTSFGERLGSVYQTLYSLFRQTRPPNRIILWLAESEFPRKDSQLPEVLRRFTRLGLEIGWCDDLKSYKKLVPTLQRYPNDIVITADDDIFYREKWLDLLYASYQRDPLSIHCHRAHRVGFDGANTIRPYGDWEKEIDSSEPSFLNFFTTGGGVLFPPGSLHKDATDIGLFQRLCPTADDIWFWSMALRNRRPIRVVEGCHKDAILLDPELQAGLKPGLTLWQINVTANDSQLKNVLDHFERIDSLRQLVTRELHV